MKQLTVVLLAWTILLDVRVIPLFEAPREGLVPTGTKYESLEPCETAIDSWLANTAVLQEEKATVEGDRGSAWRGVIFVRGKNTYILRHFCAPDSLEPGERTEVG